MTPGAGAEMNCLINKVMCDFSKESQIGGCQDEVNSFLPPLKHIYHVMFLKWQ